MPSIDDKTLEVESRSAVHNSEKDFSLRHCKRRLFINEKFSGVLLKYAHDTVSPVSIQDVAFPSLAMSKFNEGSAPAIMASCNY